MTILYLTNLSIYMYDENKPVDLDGRQWRYGGKYYKFIRFGEFYHETIMSLEDIDNSYHIEHDEYTKGVMRQLAIRVVFEKELDEL